MKFRFPLQKVMEHRKVLEDIAQRDFQAAVADLNRCKQQIVDMHEKIKAAQIQASQTQTQGGIGITDYLRQIHEFIKGQDIRIEREQAKVKEYEKLVEERRDFLRQKAVEYKIIERLRDKKLEEHKHEINTRDQKEIDEMNVLRFENEEIE